MNAELEELQQQQLDQSLLGINEQEPVPVPTPTPTPALPSVPQVLPESPRAAPVQPQRQAVNADEEEFRKLAEDMSFA